MDGATRLVPWKFSHVAVKVSRFVANVWRSPVKNRMWLDRRVMAILLILYTELQTHCCHYLSFMRTVCGSIVADVLSSCPRFGESSIKPVRARQIACPNRPTQMLVQARSHCLISNHDVLAGEVLGRIVGALSLGA